VNEPTCIVLDGGDNSGGRILFRDCRATRDVLGSGARPDQIAEARGAGEAHYLVRFGTRGGGHVRQLLAQEQSAIERRRQEAVRPVLSTDWVHEEMAAQRERGERAQRLIGLLSDARREAEAAKQQTGAAVDRGAQPLARRAHFSERHLTGKGGQST